MLLCKYFSQINKYTIVTISILRYFIITTVIFTFLHITEPFTEAPGGSTWACFGQNQSWWWIGIKALTCWPSTFDKSRISEQTIYLCECCYNYPYITLKALGLCTLHGVGVCTLFVYPVFVFPLSWSCSLPCWVIWAGTITWWPNTT